MADDPLVIVSDVTARLGRPLADEAETTRVSALIDDVSGEVWLLVGDDAFRDSNGALTVPKAVVAVVCEAVIRRIDNPRGLTGETLGDHSWQASSGRGAGLYLLPAERRTVRRAAGQPPVGTLTLEGDLPIAPGVVSLQQLLDNP